MKSYLRYLPNWGAFAASIGLMISVSTFAISAYRNAGASIHRLSSLGVALSETARTVRESIHPPEYAQALRDRKKDLDTRLIECAKPNLVVTEISGNIRGVGASVLEIKPLDSVRSTGPSPDKNALPVYPRYQVAMLGTYQQVAEFMKHCTRQRLPVRVADFMLTATDYKSEKNEPMLRAEVTVESYQEPKRESEGQSS